MRIQGLMVLGLLSLAMIGGCCEQEKKQIASLRADNESLTEQLRKCNESLDQKEADLMNCRGELDNARRQLAALGIELDRARTSQQKLPTGWTVKDGKVMTSLSEKVLFDPGKNKLKSSAGPTLKRIISEIRANFPGHDIYVVGHTDSDPIRRSGWQDNLQLSVERSAAVTRFMTSNGLDAKRVVTSGCGQYRPVSSNSSAAGKQSNRRVEFWVLQK